MPDIHLHLNGQQAGPYSVSQLRQLVAEGKVSPETPAWYQGLAEWSTVSQVLAAFPAEGGPPAFVPPKKGMSGCVLALIIACSLGVVGTFFLAVFAGIALGPIQKGIEKAKENAAMQSTRAIGLAMFAYATDHNGAYPDGATSTEVFQKLLDGNYVTDPALFYIAMTGKVRPTSNHLTADNVCYDVTSGATPGSPDGLPLVFTTGYTMVYSAGAAPTRDAGVQVAFPAIAIAYKGNSARVWAALPDGTVPAVIPSDFDPGTATYRQLKP